MSDNIKQTIITELDNRIELLKEHQHDEIIPGNQYSELNQALAKIIGAPLIGELDNIKDFVQKL